MKKSEELKSSIQKKKQDNILRKLYKQYPPVQQPFDKYDESVTYWDKVFENGNLSVIKENDEKNTDN